MIEYIGNLDLAFIRSVATLVQSRPDLWNNLPFRTFYEDSPHKGIDDIFFRFCDPDKSLVDLDKPYGFHWYPEAEEVPQILPIVSAVADLAEASLDDVGIVLMTRISPNGVCKPHIDQGFHAREYDKYLVQIQGSPEQYFCFHGATVAPRTAEVWKFENTIPHWVVNASPVDRISLIVGIRRKKKCQSE